MITNYLITPTNFDKLDVNDPADLNFWCCLFSVSEETLIETSNQIGNNLKVLEKEFMSKEKNQNQFEKHA